MGTELQNWQWHWSIVAEWCTVCEHTIVIIGSTPWRSYDIMTKCVFHPWGVLQTASICTAAGHLQAKEIHQFCLYAEQSAVWILLVPCQVPGTLAVLSGLGKPVWGSLLQLLALDQPACLHKAQLQSTEAALLVKHKWFSYLLYKKKMLCKAASNLLTARFYTQRGGFIISVHAGKLILFLVAYWVLVNKLQEERLKKKCLQEYDRITKLLSCLFSPMLLKTAKCLPLQKKCLIYLKCCRGYRGLLFMPERMDISWTCWVLKCWSSYLEALAAPVPAEDPKWHWW